MNPNPPADPEKKPGFWSRMKAEWKQLLTPSPRYLLPPPPTQRPREVRPFGVPPFLLSVEMPPVKPPRQPDAVHGETFARYEDANVFNETKPFYVGRQPKPLKPAPGPAAAYVALYPELVRVAREHGYALAVHGSVARDFDLVAVPWTPEATDALTLIKALKAATGGVTTSAEWDELMPSCHPVPKPHSRVCYSIHFTEQGAKGPYLDVSVMPRVGNGLPSDEAAMT
jgi:hypothetical protein